MRSEVYGATFPHLLQIDQQNRFLSYKSLVVNDNSTGVSSVPFVGFWWQRHNPISHFTAQFLNGPAH
jgi:hypothetical protein